jgi:trimeric autotransporter adhesin
MKLKTHVTSLYGLSLLLAVGGSGLASAQENTHYGTSALLSNTSGVGNDAFGGNALYWNTTGSENLASGYDALAYNTSGSYNGASGSYALLLNTTGSYNTASGYQALYYNTIGSYNNAIGAKTLLSNTSGNYNNAVGYLALYHNTTGVQNNGSGYGSLYSNTTGNYNSGYGAFTLYVNTTGTGSNATGYGALYRNTTGAYNSAEGYFALGYNTTGGNNIAVGPYAGYNLTTGSNNIDIGSRGVGAETAVIRIGTQGTQRATFVAGVSGVNVTGGATVVVNSSGQLGVMSSSRRYKEDIRSMGNVSDRLLALRPVTFRYKTADENGQKPEQYGLIAEEVAKVMPDLVVYNPKGQPETVAYQTLAPLLLNELQREHKRADRQADELRQARDQLAHVQNELVELRRITTQLAATRGLATDEALPDSADNLTQ